MPCGEQIAQVNDRQASLEEKVDEGYASLEAKINAVHASLDAKIEESHASLEAKIAEGDAETRVFMRTLHEDLVQRIAVIGDKRL